jgi:hypothetical protein
VLLASQYGSFVVFKLHRCAVPRRTYQIYNHTPPFQHDKSMNEAKNPVTPAINGTQIFFADGAS